MSKSSEELTKLDALLDEYEQNLGIPKFQDSKLQTLSWYLNLSRDELEALSAEECLYAAYELSQIAFWAQRYSNREIARINWADATLSEYVASVADNYFDPKTYKSWDERKFIVSSDDSYAKAVLKIRTWAKQRADRIAFLSGRIEYMCKVLTDLNQTKRKNISREN